LSTRCLGEPWCPGAAAAGQGKELPTGSESAAMPQPRVTIINQSHNLAAL
jgi:hypothetical protein